MAFLAIVLCMLIHSESPRIDWSNWDAFKKSVDDTGPWIKLTILCLYMSLACTFIPLNTSWIISAAAIAPGITGEIATTTLAVAITGAVSSTVANLNDYHVFTLMLRSEKIAKIRHTKTYSAAERWFARTPFGILTLFNVIPIPVDVSRPLAASHRYPRHLFAAANFLGRFVRYSIIAALTFTLGEQGWIVTVALIGAAALMIATKLVLSVLKKRTRNSQEA
jgi:membrane protein YqaA with SNARE-associated domain